MVFLQARLASYRCCREEEGRLLATEVVARLLAPEVDATTQEEAAAVLKDVEDERHEEEFSR